MRNEFTKNLLEWNRDLNNRLMPWKGESDPYRIWLSEIILQQTRVEQGTRYYEKFIALFPTVKALAEAPEKEVFKNWEGLGYYSRCRNLIATARKIAWNYGSIFPAAYDELLALPGIGPYTAAAIASFAFSLPYAVVDGNVERVLSRYFGISTPVGSAAGKKMYKEISGELLDKKNPGVYNQAIMDFGATICKPLNPLCSHCVMSKDCQAFHLGRTNQLPVKAAAPLRKKRCFYYFIADSGKNEIWIRERAGKDIWQNLYEFILYETGKLVPKETLQKTNFFRENFGDKGIRISHISPVYKQTLTHQSISGCFVYLDKALHHLSGYQPVSRDQLINYPFPKFITGYMKDFPSLR